MRRQRCATDRTGAAGFGGKAGQRPDQTIIEDAVWMGPGQAVQGGGNVLGLSQRRPEVRRGPEDLGVTSSRDQRLASPAVDFHKHASDAAWDGLQPMPRSGSYQHSRAHHGPAIAGDHDRLLQAYR